MSVYSTVTSPGGPYASLQRQPDCELERLFNEWDREERAKQSAVYWVPNTATYTITGTSYNPSNVWTAQTTVQLPAGTQINLNSLKNQHNQSD